MAGPRRTRKNKRMAIKPEAPLDVPVYERSGIDISGTAIAIILWVESPSKVMRCIALFVAFVMFSHWVWFTRRWHRMQRVTAIAVLLAGFLILARPLVFPDPTYVYFMISKGLAENTAVASHEMIPRRAFVLIREGPDILHNVSVTLVDNRGPALLGQLYNDHLETYSEIDPGLSVGAEPTHFWIQPTKPWDEDYSIAITSREIQISETVRVSCWCSNVFYAIRVVGPQSAKPIFSCRDKGFVGDLTTWKQDAVQSCSSLMTNDPRLAGNLDPRPFVITFPTSLIDMTPNAMTASNTALIGRAYACPATVYVKCH